MGWWPFKRKVKVIASDPHMRSARMWLQELQEACERNFDNHVEGQRSVRQLQVEWTDAFSESEISSELREGLDRRAFRLLRADGEEWLRWLDDESFWSPGWRIDDGAPASD